MPHYDDEDNDAVGDEELDDKYDREYDHDWDHQPLWQTALPIVAALVVGAIVGLVLGAQFFGTAKASENVSSQTCLILASELFRQGESIEVVQEHLTALGYNNAAPTVLKLADDYAALDEPLKKRQSVDLRQLGEALLVAADRTGTPGVIAPTAQTTRTPARTTPLATATKAKTAAPTAAPTQAAAAPTSTTVTQPPADTPQQGHITSTDRSGAKMRKDPTTTSEIVAYLNDGDQVQVLGIVEGEAIDPVEPRWYKVQRNSTIGYIYFKLVVPGE
jgi:hypothetical protein